MNLTLYLQRRDLEGKQPKDDKNGVWVENPHLYPHLLRFAFQKLGLAGRELQRAINHTFEHETQHLIPIIGSSQIKSRLGIRFYKMVGLPFISIYQPEIEYSGKVTLKEEIDIATNVSHPSVGDKEDLREALDYAEKLKQAREKSLRATS